MNRWMDGQMDGWIDEQIELYMNKQYYLSKYNRKSLNETTKTQSRQSDDKLGHAKMEQFTRHNHKTSTHKSLTKRVNSQYTYKTLPKALKRGKQQLLSLQVD